MGWDKHSAYGVIKHSGKIVKIYRNVDTCDSIQVSHEITDARWSGEILIITMSNGKVRRYKNRDTFTEV